MPTVSSLGAALITPDPVDPDNAYYNGGIAHNSEGAMYVVGGAGNQIPYVLSQSGIPYGIANSGTVAVNGTYTAGTAYNTTYSGGIYLYFPATAFATAPAGFYWCVASSTTAFTVYTDNSATTPVTGSNAAFTGSTAQQNAVTITVPGGAMGANGSLRIFSGATLNNTAGAKSLTNYIGAAVIGTSSPTTSTNTSLCLVVSNRNSESSQRSSTISGNSTVIGGFTTANTAEDFQITIRLQLATATDWIVLEHFLVEVLPGA
jgi:hypothetical protein